MRRKRLRAAHLAAVEILFSGGAGTETRAQYSRRIPIVEAVEKTRASVVTIKPRMGNKNLTTR
jgi:hypothetical protein